MLKKIFTAAALLLSINAFAGNGTAGVVHQTIEPGSINIHSTVPFPLTVYCSSSGSKTTIPSRNLLTNGDVSYTEDDLNQCGCGGNSSSYCRIIVADSGALATIDAELDRSGMYGGGFRIYSCNPSSSGSDYNGSITCDTRSAIVSLAN